MSPRQGNLTTTTSQNAWQTAALRLARSKGDCLSGMSIKFFESRPAGMDCRLQQRRESQESCTANRHEKIDPDARVAQY